MKKISVLIFTLTMCASADVLEDFSKEIKDKVQLGMTTAEVRSVIGSPKIVQSGFPQASEGIIDEAPKLAGQLVQSTWFYFKEPIDKVTFFNGILYQINGAETTKELYDQYKGRGTVYRLDKKIIDAGMASGYRLTRNEKLDSLSINKETTTAKDVGKVTITKKYVPMVCVIFERGTQSVAAVKIYFKLVNSKMESGY